MKPNSLLLEIIILGFGFLVRLIQLNGSFWLDEAAQALESIRPLAEQFDIAADFQPPLFHLLVHLMIQFNQTEWFLRLASLVPGLLTIWLTIRIGKRLFTHEVGLMAGILLASSQFHLFYSQELRPYSLAACLALITFWGWLDLMQSPKKISLLFFFAALSGLYTTYLFPVFLLSLLILTFIFYRPKTLFLGIYFLVFIIGFLPWIPSLIHQTNLGTSLAAAKPLWASIVSPPVIKMLPLVYLKFLLGRIPFDPNLLSMSGVGIISVIILAAFNRTRHKKSGPLVIGLSLLPILLGFIISLFVPVLDPKRVLFALPFLYLGIVAGLGKRFSSALVLALFLTINLWAVGLYATNPDNQREPWREAIAVLEADLPNDTLAIFAFTAPFAPWDWYQTRSLSTLSVTEPKTMSLINNQHIVFFEYLKPLYDPTDQIMANLENQGFFETGFYQYPGIGKMRVYAR
ncbi:MAG TPA: glycosyltransferase family 39 protein [Anaerolineales bacterium]|nr:glycosyltransferase family 39 protein [Anaerolineales bacterium]